MKGIIIYATRYGCTEKAAKILQKKIPGIKTVNIMKEKAPDLSLFDTVILGGPIYVGKTLSGLASYMQQNIEILKKKKLALFLCAGEQDSVQIGRLLRDAFPEEIYRIAAVHEVFGGELRWEKLDFMTRLILKLVKGIKEGYSRLSEEKIGRFANEISGL